MVVYLILALGVGLVLTFALVYVLRKGLQENQQRTFEYLEKFQAGLAGAQREQERNQDSKQGLFRSEIQQELANNRRELQQGLTLASQTLEQKVQAMDTRIENRLKELSGGVQQKLEANLKEGFVHFEKVQQHLKQAESQLLHLNQVAYSVNELNSLLKMPHLRGGFGEAILENILSDLLPADSFELQYQIVPSSTERVDAVIKYPKLVLPIDSKFPREQVLHLFEATDPKALEAARAALTDVVKVLAKQIKDKYIRPDYGTTDMALLFVPSETLYFEVLRNSRLLDELNRQKVFIVSPNTLSITLHAISMAQNYYEMAKGMEKTIQDIRRAQNHFEHFEKRFEDVGSSLNKALQTYHMASTHLSRYSGAVTRLSGKAAAPLEADAAPQLPTLDA